MFVSVAMLPSLLPCDIRLSPVNLRVRGEAVSDVVFRVIVGEYFSRLSVDLDLGVGWSTPTKFEPLKTVLYDL